MNSKSKNKNKIVISCIMAFLLVAMFAISGIGIYYNYNKRSPGAQITNPIDWSIDEWDGETSSDGEWFDGNSFGDRGQNTYTIDSAESFAYFISLVNNEATAHEYNYFRDYTIYLNTNIDMAGHSIDSIGVKVEDGSDVYSTFQGTFDGSYYTIYNANINGSGLFGYVENAVIKNIGLYNCTINTAEEYVGGIVGYAINTNIENTYVRLGSISGTNTVGGIVGQFFAMDGNYSISNSFADTTINGSTVGGIIGYANTNYSQNNSISINYSYAVGVSSLIGRSDSSLNIDTTNSFIANNIAQFYAWDYAADYSVLLEKTWCNYSNVEGSTRLSFNHPILSRFNKVFMTGSCYENTVTDEKTGEVTNVETIADAFATADVGEVSEVNLIVEEVYVNTTAIVQGSAGVELYASKEAKIVRGKNLTDAMIIAGEESSLVIGDNEESAQIVIDGNREYVEENNLRSSAAIVIVDGYGAYIDNCTIQNNVNNIDGRGGLVSIISSNRAEETETTRKYMSTIKSTSHIIPLGSAADVNGSYTLGTGSTLSGGSASEGGGIHWDYNGNNKNCNLYGKIRNNHATSRGGGVFLYVAISIFSSSGYGNVYIGSSGVERRYAKIYNNTVQGDGGGVFMYAYRTSGAHLRVYCHGQIHYNTASGYGGGVATYGQGTNEFTLYGQNNHGTGKIYNNKAANGGGMNVGSDNTPRDITIYGLVYGNTATRDGGGIRADYNSKTSFSGLSTSTVYDNSANGSGDNTYGFGYCAATIYYRTASGTSTRTTQTRYYLDPYKIPDTYGSYYNNAGLASSSSSTSNSGISWTMGSNTSCTRYVVGSKTLTYYYNGTSSTNTQYYSHSSMTSNSKNINATTTAPSGYSFYGWRTSSSITNGTTSAPSTVSTISSVPVPNSSRTVYATYRKTWIYYTGKSEYVRYKYYDYYISGSQTDTYTASRSGLTFEGWVSSSTATSGYTTSVTCSSASVIRYAVWSDNSYSYSTTGSYTHTFHRYRGSSYTTSTSYTNNYTGGTKYYNYNLTTTRGVQDGSLSSTDTAAIPWQTASLSGFNFAGWSLTNSNTRNWTSGSYTPTRSTSFYAVWARTHRFYNTPTSTDSHTVYYSYNRTANSSTTYSKSNQGLSGYTFKGYSSSNSATVNYSKGTSSTNVTSTVASKTFYAVWYGSVVTSTNNSSATSAYGSTITASFETGSGSSITDKTAYRQQYYTYNTGYYNQNHSYNLAKHSGSQTSKETERYYRLVNNGSTGSWSTSIPTLTLTVPYQTSTLTGYTLKGWGINYTNTGPTWTSGTLNITSSKTYYAIWYGSVVTSTGNESDVSSYGNTITASFNEGSGSAVSKKSAHREQYYIYDTGYYNQNHNYNLTTHAGSETNQETERYYRLINNGAVGSWQTSIPTLTLTVPWSTSTLSGYTFVGWDTNASTATADWTSGSKNVTANTTFYAVWKGDVVTSTDNESDVSSYGNTITAKFYTGSGSTVSNKTAYRQQYYTFDTGYYNQNHNYNLTTHSGSQSNVETERYYRLVNNGSTGSWQTSIPTLTLTVPYATSSLSGKTFVGWDTNASTTTADWTSGSKNVTANTSYYAVWRDSSGTRDVEETLTHKFRTGTASTDFTRQTTKTTPYSGVTRYLNYNLTDSRTLDTGGTAGTPTYTALAYQTASRNDYTFSGWTTNSTSTTATWTGGNVTPTSANSYYAVWRDSTGTRKVQETLTHSFITGPTDITVVYTEQNVRTTPYTDVTRYLNYDLTRSRTLDTGGVAGTPTYTSINFYNATKSGYDLIGWNTDASTTATWTSGTQTPTSPTTYYAVWSDAAGTREEVETLTHSFMTGASNTDFTEQNTKTTPYTRVTRYLNYDLSESRTLDTGGIAGVPTYTSINYQTAEKSGYYFEGWNIDATTTATWTSGTQTPESEMTYYAVWSDTNGEREVEEILTHSFRTGSTGTDFTLQNTKSTIYAGVTRYLNYNLTNSRTLDNGGVAEEPTYTSIDYTTATKAGYDFAGWNTDASILASWVSGTQTPTSSTTYYAVWMDTNGTREVVETLTHSFRTGITESDFTKQNTRTIPYTGVTRYLNYNLSQSETMDDGGIEGTPIYTTISYQTASRNSYTFSGWTTNPVSTSASWTSGTQTPTVETTYYAVWSDATGTRTEEETLTHSFMTGETETDFTEENIRTTIYTGVTRYLSYDLTRSRTLESGGVAGSPTYTSISYQTASKTGYDFAGWNTNASTSAIWTSGTQTPTVETTYYAVWRDTNGEREVDEYLTHSFKTGIVNNDFTVQNIKTTPYTGVTRYLNYDLSLSDTMDNGGIAGTPTYTTINYQTATKTGYDFMGWNTDASNTETWTNGTQTPTVETIYYSVWKGTNVLSRKIEGSIPTATGSYTVSFNGNTNTSGSTADIDGVIYYTYARTQTYKLQYNYDLTESKEVDISTGEDYIDTTTYGSITLPECGYEKTGYSFEHWALGSTSGETYNPGEEYTATSSDGAIFYAIWEINKFTVTFNVNGGGLVNGQTTTTIVEVPYGSTISVSENVVTINGSTVTATANPGYIFDYYTGIPEDMTVIEAITITANFAKTINITIEVTGNTNSGELYGVEVNGEPTSESVIVRSGSTVVITGQTKANNEEANEYQIVTVYVNNVMRLGPLSGEIVGGLTNLGAVEEDIKITFEFEEAYRIGVSITDNEGSEGVTIEAEKQTQDGIIAKDSPVTITIDADAIIGGVGGKEYLGIVYTSNGVQTSMPQVGNDDVIPIPNEDGLYKYEVSDIAIDSINVIIKTVVSVRINLPEGFVMNLTSEDGFVRAITVSDEYVLYGGKWIIDSTNGYSDEEISAMFAGGLYTVQRDENNNLYIQF